MFAICQELVSCKCTSGLPSIDDDSLSVVCAHIVDHVLSFTSARALHPWWTSQPRSAFRWTRLCHGSVGDQQPWEIPGILRIVNFINWITHRFNTMQFCTLMIFDVDPGHPFVLSIGPQMTQHMFSEALGRHWSHGQGGLYIQPGPDVASRTYFGLEPGDLLVWGLSEYGIFGKRVEEVEEHLSAKSQDIWIVWNCSNRPMVFCRFASKQATFNSSYFEFLAPCYVEAEKSGPFLWLATWCLGLKGSELPVGQIRWLLKNEFYVQLHDLSVGFSSRSDQLISSGASLERRQIQCGLLD